MEFPVLKPRKELGNDVASAKVFPSDILTADISCAIIAVFDIARYDIQGGHMAKQEDWSRYLPLTEATAYILLALAEPLHGYAVMQKIDQMSRGTVAVGPGTLYGAFGALEKDGLIVKVGEAERRKTYALTPKGQGVLQEHLRRTAILMENAKLVEGE
jgi:DNA-binding PadR family transcriptional regulator